MAMINNHRTFRYDIYYHKRLFYNKAVYYNKNNINQKIGIG